MKCQQILLVPILLSLLSAMADVKTKCKEPANMGLRIEKLFGSQPLQPIGTNKEMLKQKNTLGKDDVLNGTLPWKISLDRPTNERALCPWYYEIHYNANRFPSTLAFAASKHEHCVGPNGELSGNRCERVFYNVRVIRRMGCVNGTYVYGYSWERIPVSYVCVYPHFGYAKTLKRDEVTSGYPKHAV